MESEENHVKEFSQFQFKSVDVAHRLLVHRWLQKTKTVDIESTQSLCRGLGL
jgi:hypothetical protein